MSGDAPDRTLVVTGREACLSLSPISGQKIDVECQNCLGSQGHAVTYATPPLWCRAPPAPGGTAMKTPDIRSEETPALRRSLGLSRRQLMAASTGLAAASMVGPLSSSA